MSLYESISYCFAVFDFGVVHMFMKVANKVTLTKITKHF